MKLGTGGRQRAYRCTHLTIDRYDGESDPMWLWREFLRDLFLSSFSGYVPCTSCMIMT